MGAGRLPVDNADVCHSQFVVVCAFEHFFNNLIHCNRASRRAWADLLKIKTKHTHTHTYTHRHTHSDRETTRRRRQRWRPKSVENKRSKYFRTNIDWQLAAQAKGYEYLPGKSSHTYTHRHTQPIEMQIYTYRRSHVYSAKS